VSRPVILDVGGGSGEWSRQYRLAGYDVRIIDPTVWPFMRASDVPAGKVHGLLLAIPCTEFAGSGARWWEKKAREEPWKLEEAVATAREFLAVRERTDPDWWAVENPSGRLWKQVPELGKPRYSFHPWEYGDPEKKRTCMWGEHARPIPTVTVPPADIHARVHRMAPSPDRARMRSITPAGFARAFFEANP
jgi:hypothetical protein